jgi:hypothetical protein
MIVTSELLDELLSLSGDVRYVAVKTDDRIEMRQRPGICQASSSESDQYEELLVNPTVLGLTSARGRIDCGGLEFVLIRYGSFFQLVHPAKQGHVSVAIEPTADPLQLVPLVRELLTKHGLWPFA